VPPAFHSLWAIRRFWQICGFQIALSAGFRHAYRAMASISSAPATPSRTQPSTGGKWYLIVLGLSLVLIGSLFIWLLARSFLRALEMRHWPEVPCSVINSEVETRIHDPQAQPQYRQNVIFGYDWHGQTFTNDHLTLRGSPWSSDRERIEKRNAEFPVGKMVTCRVNPTNPSFAVLKPDSLAPGYTIWFPSLFVVGGSGIILGALRKKKPTASASAPPVRNDSTH